MLMDKYNFFKNHHIYKTMFYYFRKSVILLLFFTLSSNSLIAQNSRESKFKEDGVYVSLHGGFNMDVLKRSGFLIEHLKFDNPMQLFFSVVMDLDFEDMGELKGLILRMELAYKPLHFHANGYSNSDNYEEYEIKARTIAPIASVLYRVPWRWKLPLRPYGGIGAGQMFSRVSKNTLTTHYSLPYYHTFTQALENDFELYENNYVVVYTAGFTLHKRYDINCRFWRATWSPSDHIHRQLKNRSIMLTFGYRF
jgi:hypothetical protein